MIANKNIFIASNFRSNGKTAPFGSKFGIMTFED